VVVVVVVVVLFREDINRGRRRGLRRVLDGWDALVWMCVASYLVVVDSSREGAVTQCPLALVVFRLPDGLS
jgi:hypothetical protein